MLSFLGQVVTFWYLWRIQFNDISDDIKHFVQVEDRPDEEKEDQKDEIPPEDNAIEMSNDFDGNFQDDAPPDEENDENDNDEKVCNRFCCCQPF